MDLQSIIIFITSIVNYVRDEKVCLVTHNTMQRQDLRFSFFPVNISTISVEHLLRPVLLSRLKTNLFSNLISISKHV